ncbi:MAG: 5-(carboxyamino)imidazole ribonucleotide mutase [Deferribacteraceae bacterium]|jgi:5-(carboxyamino)imidazole ribonucleotide mutase|nr:5-(carboxyamino)imidazole ribonucleotide mutase [Deferribacteraceae bacterium]
MSKIGIIMGSKSDLDIVSETIKQLNAFDIEYEVIVASAHRTPEVTAEWSRNARANGYAAIIAFAGAAAHLAGVVAAETNLPVIAVPISATSLLGLDALLSMVQMPGGIPVAVMAIGKAGAKNAAIFAAQIIANNDDALFAKLETYRADMRKKIASDNEEVQRAIASM